MLGEENGAQVRDFMVRHPKYALVPSREVAAAVLGEQAEAFCGAALLSVEGLLMTPRRTDTDGFYVALMRAPG